MAIRTILAATSGGTASNGAIKLACRLARRFSAHVEGYHVMLDPAPCARSFRALGTHGLGLPMPVARRTSHRSSPTDSAAPIRASARFRHIPTDPSRAIPPGCSAKSNRYGRRFVRTPAGCANPRQPALLRRDHEEIESSQTLVTGP